MSWLGAYSWIWYLLTHPLKSSLYSCLCACNQHQSAFYHLKSLSVLVRIKRKSGLGASRVFFWYQCQSTGITGALAGILIFTLWFTHHSHKENCWVKRFTSHTFSIVIASCGHLNKSYYSWPCPAITTHESMAYTCCSHDFLQCGEKQASISSNKAKLLFSTWLKFLIYSSLCCFQWGWVDWATAAPSFDCFSAFDVHVVLVVWPNIWPNFIHQEVSHAKSNQIKIYLYSTY